METRNRKANPLKNVGQHSSDPLPHQHFQSLPSAADVIYERSPRVAISYGYRTTEPNELKTKINGVKRIFASFRGVQDLSDDIKMWQYTDECLKHEFEGFWNLFVNVSKHDFES